MSHWERKILSIYVKNVSEWHVSVENATKWHIYVENVAKWLILVEIVAEWLISVENLVELHISIENLAEWHISVENVVEWHIRILWRYQLSQINSFRLRPFNLHRNCWNCSQISSYKAALTAYNTFLEVEILHLCSCYSLCSIRLSYFSNLFLHLLHLGCPCSYPCHSYMITRWHQKLVQESITDWHEKCTKIYTLF